jgi:hypothetical protein
MGSCIVVVREGAMSCLPKETVVAIASSLRRREGGLKTVKELLAVAIHFYNFT